MDGMITENYEKKSKLLKNIFNTYIKIKIKKISSGETCIITCIHFLLIKVYLSQYSQTNCNVQNLTFYYLS